MRSGFAAVSHALRRKEVAAVVCVLDKQELRFFLPRARDHGEHRVLALDEILQKVRSRPGQIGATRDLRVRQEHRRIVVPRRSREQVERLVRLDRVEPVAVERFLSGPLRDAEPADEVELARRRLRQPAAQVVFDRLDRQRSARLVSLRHVDRRKRVAAPFRVVGDQISAGDVPNDRHDNSLLTHLRPPFVGRGSSPNRMAADNSHR